MNFSSQGEHLVYLDKVFDLAEAEGNPLIRAIDTGLLPSTDFVVEYEARDLRNCAVPCPLAPNAVFIIQESCVELELVRLVPPGTITPAQVSLNGFPVDSVTLENGVYTAGITNVLDDATEGRCSNCGDTAPTLFLAQQIGPFEIRVRIELIGTVNVGGRTCAFRVTIRSGNNTTTQFPLPMTSNFSIPDLRLPCPNHGTPPTIVFRFEGDVDLANPRLYVTDCMPNTSDCSLAFRANLVFTPRIHVEVIRRTLIAIEGRVESEESERERDCDIMSKERNRHRDEDDEVGGISLECCRRACRICRLCRDRFEDEVGGVEDEFRACDRVLGAETGGGRGRACGCSNLVGGVEDEDDEENHRHRKHKRDACQFHGSNGWIQI